MTVTARLGDLLVERFGVTEDQLGPEVTFEELDLDSLDLVDFALAAEEVFGVRITDDEAEGLKTLGDAATLIEAKGARLAGA